MDGKSTVLHEPASEEEIDALEARLDIVLPDDYKEFLRSSNGMEGIWNGYWAQKVLAGTEIVAWSEDWWDENGIDFALLTWEEFPFKFPVKWPKIDLNQVLVINENDEPDHVWLVNPELAKLAVEAFFEAFDALEIGTKERSGVEQIVEVMFDGGIEGIRETARRMGCDKVERWRDPPVVWGGFREFLEALCVASEN